MYILFISIYLFVFGDENEITLKLLLVNGKCWFVFQEKDKDRVNI